MTEQNAFPPLNMCLNFQFNVTVVATERLEEQGWNWCSLNTVGWERRWKSSCGCANIARNVA